MSGIDQTKEDRVIVQQLLGDCNKVQAEKIADQFASISNLYQPLNSDDVEIPKTDESASHPLFEPYQIYEKIKSMKKKASTVPGDVTWSNI